MIKIKQNIKYLGTAATVVCRKHQTSHARHLLYIQDTSPKSRKLLGPCCVRSAASSFGTSHGAAFCNGRPGHPVLCPLQLWCKNDCCGGCVLPRMLFKQLSKLELSRRTESVGISMHCQERYLQVSTTQPRNKRIIV